MKYKNLKRRKAQAWGFDMMIASIIFISGIIIFYVYSLNYPKESQEVLDRLYSDGDFIAELILSEGLPVNWDAGNVIRIGLTTNNKINETKLERFYNLADSQSNPAGYAQAKSIFSTKYNFFMNFSQQMTVGSNPVQGVGKSFQNEQVTNIIKITRATIYQNKIVSLDLYIWE